MNHEVVSSLLISIVLFLFAVSFSWKSRQQAKNVDERTTIELISWTFFIAYVLLGVSALL